MGQDEKLLLLTTNALEEALEISSDEISNIETFGTDYSLEMDLDGASFVREYYKGERVSISVEDEGDRAILRVFFGGGCKNPRLADEFIDRYLKTTRYPGIWNVPQSSGENYSLMLETRFRYDSSYVFSYELSDRLSLFANERFTNELRPFIHYFE